MCPVLAGKMPGQRQTSLPRARKETIAQGTPKKNTISRGLIKTVSLFLPAVCSGSKHVTADAMPEDKTGAHAGAGMPSVESMRRGRQPDEKST